MAFYRLVPKAGERDPQTDLKSNREFILKTTELFLVFSDLNIKCTHVQEIFSKGVQKYSCHYRFHNKLHINASNIISHCLYVTDPQIIEKVNKSPLMELNMDSLKMNNLI